jgi:KDO2-lipid IV(A) lauroyltransferase
MYFGFQGLRLFVQPLPLGLARALGRGMGTAAFHLLAGQRRLAEQHLCLALPEALSPSQRRRVARGVFRNIGQTAMEWLVLPRLSDSRLQRLVTMEGTERLREALAKGRGAILLTAHLGNWELITFCVTQLGFSGGVLARPLRYPEYESFFTQMRRAKGVTTLARGSLKEAAKLLRANQLIGVLPDQDVDRLEGIFVEFFGRPAYTPVGPAALSLMTGAPLVPCFAVREGERFRFVVEPPLAAPETPDRREALAALTQAWSAVVESYIRRYPDQWVWMHRRWKTQPVNEVKEVKEVNEVKEVKEVNEVKEVKEEGGDIRPPASSFRLPASGFQPPTKQFSRPALALSLGACGLLLGALFAGCGKRAAPAAAAREGGLAEDPRAAQQMSGFKLTGYGGTGAKEWELDGTEASVEDGIVTILRPDGVGYEPERTATLKAGAARINQRTRHVRMEQDVTIRTSDGLWLTTPVLHWMPDQDRVATDLPVRLETDHMLLRARGMTGLTELGRVTFEDDVELVLNPSDHEAPGDGPKQVFITCDGPLTFDYQHHIATFEENVHVRDPGGDLYSDKLVAYLDEQTRAIRYAEAIGRVRIVQQQNTARSERAVYEPALGKMTLVGKPSLLVYPSDSDEDVQLSFGGLTATAR